MDSFIFIDGIALYLFFAVFIGLALGVIFYGNAYVKEARERDKAEAKYKKLRSNYNKLVGMYQRDTFKVPEVDGCSNGVVCLGKESKDEKHTIGFK